MSTESKYQECINENIATHNAFYLSELRDQFACHALLAVMQETQEMRIGSFRDWIKQLLVTYLNFTFLTVNYVQIANAYEEAAKRAYQYADALLAARNIR